MVRKSLGRHGVAPRVARANGTQSRSRHPAVGASLPSLTAMPVRRLTPFGPPSGVA
jgi:hypothetical protein